MLRIDVIVVSWYIHDFINSLMSLRFGSVKSVDVTGEHKQRLRVSFQHKFDVVREMSNELRRTITGAEVDDKSHCVGHSTPKILGVLLCRLDFNTRRLEVSFDNAATSPLRRLTRFLRKQM